MKKNQILSIYSFLSYKEFIKYIIESNRKMHGYQSKLAAAAGCQASYLSQVLHSQIHLSIEHGYNLAIFWKLNEQETSYFIDLLNYERAGSQGLQSYYKSRLIHAQDEHKNLSTKFKKQTAKSFEEQIIYHSHWMMSAVYALCMIPNERDVITIAKKLGCSEKDTFKFLSKLEKMGFVEKQESEYIAGIIDIHLGKESPFLPLFHRNWREKAIEDAMKNPKSIHYTSLYVMTKKAFEEFEMKIVNFIEDTRTLALTSGTEEVVCFNMDFFKITQ